MQYIELSGNKLKDIGALKGLEAMNSAYLRREPDQRPYAGQGALKAMDAGCRQQQSERPRPPGALTRLSTLNVDGNQVSGPIRACRHDPAPAPVVRNNQVKDISTLVEMAEKDIAGDSRSPGTGRSPFKGTRLATRPRLNRSRH